MFICMHHRKQWIHLHRHRIIKLAIKIGTLKQLLNAHLYTAECYIVRNAYAYLLYSTKAIFLGTPGLHPCQLCYGSSCLDHHRDSCVCVAGEGKHKNALAPERNTLIK